MKPKFLNIGFKFSPDGPEGGAPAPSEPAKTEQATTPKPANDNANLLKEIEQLRKQNLTYKEQESARREKQAKENGEFEKLYLQLKEEKEQLSQQVKKERINNMVSVKAMRAGLKNEAFLKMFDASNLEMDDTGDIPDLEMKITEFKEKFPELFDDGGSIKKDEDPKSTQEPQKKVPKVHNDRLRVIEGLQTNEVEELTKLIRDPNTNRRVKEKAIAKRLMLKQKQKK